MANYTFINKNTGDEEIHEMKISELDDFKANNAHLEQILTVGLGTVDPVLLGRIKPPAEFQREVLGKIKKGAGRETTIGTGRWSV